MEVRVGVAPEVIVFGHGGGTFASASEAVVGVNTITGEKGRDGRGIFDVPAVYSGTGETL